MRRFRDFDAGQAEVAGEPITFQYGGESFSLPAELPAIVILSTIALQGDTSAEIPADKMMHLIRGIFGADTDRLLATNISVPKLEEVLLWVIGQYTGEDDEDAEQAE